MEFFIEKVGGLEMDAKGVFLSGNFQNVKVYQPASEGSQSDILLLTNLQIWVQKVLEIHRNLVLINGD